MDLRLYIFVKFTKKDKGLVTYVDRVVGQGECSVQTGCLKLAVALGYLYGC